jgi:hypothetical protein
MTQQRRKGKAYKSPSTGQACDAAQYIAEVVCTRKSEKKNTGNLGYKFWNKSHKDEYQGQIVAARRLMKEFGEKTVISFLTSSKGNNIYSLGFFTPLPFVKNAIAKFKVQFDKEQAKIDAQQKQSEPRQEVLDIQPIKPFAKKNNLFSKIKSMEKNDNAQKDNNSESQ